MFKGEFIFPRLLFSDFLLSIINSPNKSWESYSLSKKEKLVAGYLIEGMTNKEIAKNMKLTEKTIKAHLTHIYIKLSCRNRTEAITKLIR